MKYGVVVTRKGQTTIPAKLREKYGTDDPHLRSIKEIETKWI
ncbi:MAG: AbrB/MazE/SpoVT family DNA-binding domain-containing protein [Candidatus Bathyarchaeia archaeon]